jgi:hypothetical protein
VPLADIESLDKSVRDRILNSIEKSLASPYPATESILDNVFCE